MDYCRYTNYQVWKMIYISRGGSKNVLCTIPTFDAIDVDDEHRRCELLVGGGNFNLSNAISSIPDI